MHFTTSTPLAVRRIWILLWILLETSAFCPISQAALPLSPDPETAMRQFQVAAGLQVGVFASEPMLANPVSIAFDGNGRLYVVETYRHRTSVFDIRQYRQWLEEDLALRTVDDRRKWLQETVTPSNQVFQAQPRRRRQDRLGDFNGDGRIDFHDLEIESERIRRLADTNDDGRADQAGIFADGFNELVSGVAAGILPFSDEIWFACVPDLWRLRDDNDDGRVDTRETVHTGFGVHVGYGGHDLHGLIRGPDGKIYFTMGDRGAHVTSTHPAIRQPDTGAVFRCNPDGSDLELFAYGLRNPQDLAFDRYGNLWTADQNADGGDAARWVYLVEGGNSGWHIGWQWLPDLGPWNSEKLWELPSENTAAYLVPPIAHIGHGPAGIAYYPGTGMPEKYNDSFFLADFPGGVRTFEVEPNGASFTVSHSPDILRDNNATNETGKLLWNLWPVDVAFAPGGGAHVADWTQGWEKTGEGRVYRVFDPKAIKDPVAQETQQLLKGVIPRSATGYLARLLGHRDMRVRLEAQFELAGRGTNALAAMKKMTLQSSNQLARLHAIWGLGQMHRQVSLPDANANDRIEQILLNALNDSDPEVRGQAAKTAGNLKIADAHTRLVELLSDANDRVRFFAAMALGKLGQSEAIPPLLSMLEENADRDPYLRHAGVMAFTRINDIDRLITMSQHRSRAVRLAILLALRRLEQSEVATYLRDPDPALRREAARAIHDKPIPDAMSELASLIRNPNLPRPVWRRAINANFRLGRLEHALALVDLATNPRAKEAMRVDALDALAAWGDPPARDRVLGLWRPIDPRPGRAASIVMRPELKTLFDSDSDSVQAAAAQAAGRLQLWDAADYLYPLVENSAESPAVRSEALSALGRLKDARLSEAITIASNSEQPALRSEALNWLRQVPNSKASQILRNVLENGTTEEKQVALNKLAHWEAPEAVTLLDQTLDRLLAGELNPALQLDVLQAAGDRQDSTLQEKLKRYENSRDPDDPLSGFREALYGGDPEAGRQLFRNRTDLACLRCHRIHGDGAMAGPELSARMPMRDREFILESIVYPNRAITPGYEQIIVTLENGKSYSGRIDSEDPSSLVLKSPEDGVVIVSKGSIQSRNLAASTMPTGLDEFMTQSELRDLVAFLAELH